MCNHHHSEISKHLWSFEPDANSNSLSADILSANSNRSLIFDSTARHRDQSAILDRAYLTLISSASRASLTLLSGVSLELSRTHIRDISRSLAQSNSKSRALSRSHTISHASSRAHIAIFSHGVFALTYIISRALSCSDSCIFRTPREQRLFSSVRD